MSGEKRNNEFGESSNPKRYHYKNEEEEELQDIPDLDTEIQNDNQLENKVDDTSNSVLKDNKEC
ncbi:17188_t:CDS:2 [Rhizophagus irregularis]|nr:17188_t:CDS:2 [Rhizophagus irregularis]